jgi:hypothetical protein
MVPLDIVSMTSLMPFAALFSRARVSRISGFMVKSPSCLVLWIGLLENSLSSLSQLPRIFWRRETVVLLVTRLTWR